MAEYRDSKTFVVSWINFSDNVLYSQQVEALHEWHAIEESSQDIFSPTDMHFMMNKEDLYETAWDRGAMIEVIEIK